MDRDIAANRFGLLLAPHFLMAQLRRRRACCRCAVKVPFFTYNRHSQPIFEVTGPGDDCLTGRVIIGERQAYQSLLPLPHSGLPSSSLGMAPYPGPKASEALPTETGKQWIGRTYGAKAPVPDATRRRSRILGCIPRINDGHTCLIIVIASITSDNR
jgi:hypothetical protein